MLTVYLETEKKERGKYELIQAWEKIDERSTRAEMIDEYETEDRLLAAIVNLGFACRRIAEGNYKCAYVDLKSDQDGKDYRYDKEHNTLYSLLFPDNSNEARKVNSLYSEYLKYLLRIKQLIAEWKITVTLAANE